MLEAPSPISPRWFPEGSYGYRDTERTSLLFGKQAPARAIDNKQMFSFHGYGSR